MPRKLFLRFDRGSISNSDMSAFVTTSSVTNIDLHDNCFQFSFAPIVLDHALLLLGENKGRFGFNLWHYLHSAHGFFGQTTDGFVIMPGSGSDFRRRFSEDLGVAVGSVFLVDSLGLKWETITQIPTNKRLDKHAKVPDFVGFDVSGQKRVYECKGTTSANDVDKHREKAKAQLADHKEANVSKFAMVTYIPTSPQLIPPFLFVSDPPIPLPHMAESLSTGLHYLLALEFAGQDALTTPLRQALALRYRIDEIIANGEEPNWNQRHALQNLNDQFVATANSLAQQSNLQAFQGERFAGVWRIAEEEQRTVKAFSGVSVKQLSNVATALASTPDPQRPFEAPRFQAESSLHDNAPQLFSLFSDGTLLLIEKP